MRPCLFNFNLYEFEVLPPFYYLVQAISSPFLFVFNLGNRVCHDLALWSPNSRSDVIDSFSLRPRFLLFFTPSTVLLSTFYAAQLPAYSGALYLSPSPVIYRPYRRDTCCLGLLISRETPTSAIRDRVHRESYAYPLVAC